MWQRLQIDGDIAENRQPKQHLQAEGTSVRYQVQLSCLQSGGTVSRCNSPFVLSNSFHFFAESIEVVAVPLNDLLARLNRKCECLTI